MSTPLSQPLQPSLFQNSPEIMSQNQPQHSLACPIAERDEEGFSIYLDDDSDVSTITCSVMDEEEQYELPTLKRTRNSMDLAVIDGYQGDRSKKRRRRGTSYTIVEIHSLLHLMKRVLPKSADEWELIRIVHSRIFPDNDRTVSSLKKKFKELCRDTDGRDLLYTRFRAQPVHGKFEVDKAREVQNLITLKPPGYQLILPKTSKDQVIAQNTEPLPHFQVKVPNPLAPPPITEQQGTKQVPECIQIPDSPALTAEVKANQDNMSALNINEYEAAKNQKAFTHSTPIIPTEIVVTGLPTAWCDDTDHTKKTPVVICDHK